MYVVVEWTDTGYEAQLDNVYGPFKLKKEATEQQEILLTKYKNERRSFYAKGYEVMKTIDV